MNYNGQHNLGIAPLNVLPLGDTVNSIVGTATTVLSKPTGASALVLCAETNNFRVRSGDASQKVFSTVDFTTGKITLNGHGYFTGFGPIQLTTDGTLPAGLALATDYWVIVVDVNNIQLASSKANAEANTPVPIVLTTNGTGNQTIGDSMPLAEAPAATTTNGANGILVRATDMYCRVVECNKVTVKGYAAGSVLTYYWI